MRSAVPASSDGGGALIELKEVSFQYEGGEEDALSDVSLQIGVGECVVLSGNSGCGKTTITRLANGLIPDFYPGKLEGLVLINGEDVLGKEPHELCGFVGSVFQNPWTQFFNTDTDSELVFGMENCGVPCGEMHRRYEDTVKTLHLENLCKRDIFQLSGGEKQSIAFGSVYALSPEIYVLDEPSANLDRRAIRRLRQVLLTLKRQGKTILIAEHRLYYLNGVADRIIRMENGRIAEDVPADRLLEKTVSELHALGLRSLWDTDIAHTPAGCPVRMPSLEVRKLSVRRGKRPVLENVSFTVQTGEILGITGRNGIGKTTLVRTVCGLMKEHSGQIYFHGSLAEASSRKHQVFLVMQDPNYQLFCESVESEMRLSLSGSAPDEDEIRELLDALDLSGVRERHPLSLSGGQKQRLCITLAALSPAQLLLFDEPTSGLDYENMRRVSDILKNLADQGKAIVVISHDHEFLAKACTQVISLEKEKR